MCNRRFLLRSGWLRRSRDCPHPRRTAGAAHRAPSLGKIEALDAIDPDVSRRGERDCPRLRGQLDCGAFELVSEPASRARAFV